MPRFVRSLSLALVCLAATAAFAADVDLDLLVFNGAAVSGKTVRIQIFVKGSGTNVSLNAPIPEGLTFASKSNDGGACTAPAAGMPGTVTCFWASASDEELQLEYNVPASAADGSTIAVTGFLTAEDDALAANNASTATFLVFGPADLAVSIDAPVTYVPGRDVEATFTLRNNGPAPARNATVAVSASGEVSYVSPPLGESRCTFSASPPEATCNVQVLAPGEAFTVPIRFAPRPANGTLRLIGRTFINPDADTVTANDLAVASLAARYTADLNVTLAAPPMATAGGNVPVAVTLQSFGPSAAPGIRFDYTLPPDSTFAALTAPGGANCTTPAVGAAGKVTCDFGALPPLDILRWYTTIITIKPAAAGTLTHTVTASTTAAEDAPANDTASAKTEVFATPAGNADLAVTIAETPHEALPGSNVTLDVDVSNDGPAASGPAAVVITPPPFATVLAVPATCGKSFDVALCSVGALTPGAKERVTLTVRLNVPPSDKAMTGDAKAQVLSASDPQPANDAATASLRVRDRIDLTILVTAPPAVPKNGVIEYRIALSDPTARATIVDFLPSNTTLIEKPAGCDGSDILVCRDVVGPLLLKVQAPNFAGTLTNTAIVSCACDNTPDNNNVDTVVRVQAAVDVRVELSAEPASVPAGEPVELRATVTNAGAEDTSSVPVTVRLPGGRFADAQDRQVQNAGPLRAGQSKIITFRPLTSRTPGTVTALATAAALDDQNPANDSASASVTMTAPIPADLAVGFITPYVEPSGALVELGINNAGPGTAWNASVRIAIPPGASANTPLATNGECSIDGAAIICTLAPLQPSATTTLAFILVPPPSGLFTIAATVTSPNDPVLANDSKSVAFDLRGADLSATLAGPATAAVGDFVEYTFTVRNDGPQDAEQLAVTFTAPPALQFVERRQSGAPLTCGELDAARSITCSVPLFANGAATTVTMRFRAASATALPQQTSVTVRSATLDHAPSNNQARILTSVYPPPPIRRHATR